MASSAGPSCITEGPTWIKRFPTLPATVTLQTVIGGRKAQEDRFCVCPNLVQHLENVAFFGVFDGTVGDFASDTVKDLVVPMLKSTSECKQLEHEFGSSSSTEAGTTGLLKRAHKSDGELLRRAGIAEKHYAASTSVTLLLWEDYICVGHLGDSRICLIYVTDENLAKIDGTLAVAGDKNGNDENVGDQKKNASAVVENKKNTKNYVVEAKWAAPGSFRTDSIPVHKVEEFVEGNFVTQDHKPDTAEEKARIEACGGSVEYLHNHQNKPFIRGGDFQQRKMLGESPMQLQYSRAFGAKDLKPFGLLGDPTVNCTKRERLGLWDVLSADVASRVAMKAFLEGTNPSDALVQAALHTSCDNITAVCVMYDTFGGDR
eukprot:CAMPEP_0178985500 /NCGR_PEP_ID=MMETSP0795-20121207/2187_1 /TAXON_ID=88552 /ORGANISM="Amoebophrya sp., Strain Ameob2" /LENGTH=373 /DNA_ID=CAMNT_0020676465 /DNA_START=234 /DNA_END=1355 /DNA_ORIENTATION=+